MQETYSNPGRSFIRGREDIKNIIKYKHAIVQYKFLHPNPLGTKTSKFGTIAVAHKKVKKKLRRR